MACGPRATPPVSLGGPLAIVTTERTSRGGRLIAVADDGSRLRALTAVSRKLTIDQHPYFTPDGAWIVFSSNREREHPAESSLWVLASRGGLPLRLTRGAHSERDPRVAPDGKTLYFASDREGSFDLYRAPLERRGRTLALGVWQRLTVGDGQELSPSVSPDGASLIYMVIDEAGESALYRQSTTGQDPATPVTQGPRDMTPAWGPKGQIAFASVAPGRDDADLYLMDVSGQNRRLVIDEPLGDETGPRWSKDGRHLFATSVFRSERDGRPLLGSVVYVDLEEPVWTLRALHEPGAVESRIGVALADRSFDPQSLAENRTYGDALRRVFLQEGIRQENEQGSRNQLEAKP